MEVNICPKTGEYGTLTMSKNEIDVLMLMVGHAGDNLEFEKRSESMTASSLVSHVSHLAASLKEREARAVDDDPLAHYRNIGFDFEPPSPQMWSDGDEMYDEEPDDF